ncbi:WXG100 family type VII secretion target [uncultured Lactobacillus sp.]|uniref:WXG100 family type VII secretion target n=1 Tax=uncultured Lactobacillus sp. TaxID=153152 RepID=UPI00263239C3|nr:WXG100 family type VII secretion target [uncultured Lactobacillus sp.]
MAGKISVTPEQLIASSNVYTNGAQQLADAINKVSAENQNMASEWSGQAFQAYLEQYSQLKTNVDQMTELLNQISQQLKKYAQTVQERDAQDSNAFGLN